MTTDSKGGIPDITTRIQLGANPHDKKSLTYLSDIEQMTEQLSPSSKEQALAIVNLRLVLCEQFRIHHNE